jgi:hypothetical protein
MKAQIVMEYLVLMGAGMITLMVFLVVIGEQAKDVSDTESKISLKDIAYAVENEIATASAVEDGYSRRFEIPKTVGRNNYSIHISDGMLLLSSSSYQVISSVPPIHGNILKGNNTINKSDGIVCLNHC